MNKLFEDKIFFFSIVLALAASGTLVSRKISQKLNAASVSVQHHQQAPVASAAPVQTYTPVPAYSAPTRSYASSRNPVIPVQKARPKNGNTWLVGSSSEADSNDLKAVLLNTENNDIVQLEAGTYAMNISDVPVEKLQIIGRDNAIIQYVDSYGDVLIKDLVFKDLEMNFGKAKYNSIRFSAYDAKITFERVKAYASGNFRLRLGGNLEFVAKYSEFKGITFNLDSSTKTKIHNSIIEKADYLFDLEGTAELELSTTTLQLFEWSAFKTQSTSVKVTGEKLTVSNGKEAFYGKFTPSSVVIQHSKFRNLRVFQNSDSDVSCYMCEKENIQR